MDGIFDSPGFVFLRDSLVRFSSCNGINLIPAQPRKPLHLLRFRFSVAICACISVVVSMCAFFFCCSIKRTFHRNTMCVCYGSRRSTSQQQCQTQNGWLVLSSISHNLTDPYLCCPLHCPGLQWDKKEASNCGPGQAALAHRHYSHQPILPKRVLLLHSYGRHLATYVRFVVWWTRTRNSSK